MAKSIIFQNVNVKNESRGRKTSTKTAKVRRSILRALEIAKSENRTMSTKDIVKASKQKKVAVMAALRWAEQNDLIVRVGTEKQVGRGRPMIVWGV